MRSLGSRLSSLWCRAVHPAPMWPVSGHYRCSVCLRSYPVPWEKRPPAAKAAPAVVLPARPDEAPVQAAPRARAAVAAYR